MKNQEHEEHVILDTYNQKEQQQSWLIEELNKKKNNKRNFTTFEE